jgi:predicted TIM-barrel fold metal-dependent hydrolase
MRPDDLILVSIDDHVVEPPDLFDRHVPARWRDQAPRLVTNEHGHQQWEFQGASVGMMGLNAVMGWPGEEWGMDPSSLAEMRPGSYDVHERIRDMNVNGVLGTMCFPTFPGFSASHLTRGRNEVAHVMVQAYNDWHLDELAAAYPGRIHPLGILPTWDTHLMVAEIERLAARGCHAVAMPEQPHVEGLPSYHDHGFWGPVFAALVDNRTVMCLHIGPGFQALRVAPDAPVDNLIILTTQVSVLAAQDLLWGPAFRAHPGLKVAFSEGGIGWIPFYLDRCDRHFTNQTWLHHEFGGKLPSEVWQEHSLACYTTDPTALLARHRIGIDNIAWECDYPHGDAYWPDAPEKVLAELQHVGANDDEINKITWQNTCRFFEWDPFTAVPKEQATVASLRALATDVDTAPRSRAEHARRFAAAHPDGYRSPSTR